MQIIVLCIQYFTNYKNMFMMLAISSIAVRLKQTVRHTLMAL